MTGTAPGPVGAAPPGEGVRELIEVMDRLRSPGGCPWDRQQTHASLAPYAVEEVYELLDAIDQLRPDDDGHPDVAAERDRRAHLREELGDVLLQVVFHARVATEHPRDPFDIDDVARGIAAKLRHRHPHVFGDVVAQTAEAVSANWERLKAAEKPERTGPLDGIPAGLPELARADKMLGRLERAGRTDLVERVVAPPDDRADDEGTRAGDEGTRADDPGAVRRHGARLLAQVAAARADGVDAATALRAVLAELEAAATP